VAPDPIRTSEPLRLGKDLELDVRSYQLWRSGRLLKLERIPMDLLLLLVECRGQLVTREQIIERIWGKDVFLDTDSSINAAVRKIRQVLQDDPERPHFLQTITGRGYRFIAPVEEASASPAIENAVSQRTAIAESLIAKEISPDRTLQRRSPGVWLVLLGISVALIAALGAYFQWSRSRARPQPPGERLMLAVLPFENLTGDAAQDYFSDGLTEEMISHLGSLEPEQLGVIARTSVMHYKHSQAPLEQIGRELGVQYVLEGSVRRDSNKVRISAQLIQMKDQTHLWSRQYDRELSSLLALQGEIAQEIADEIQLTLGGDRKRITAGHKPAASPSSYEAYDLYPKGRYFWNKRTPDGFQQAAEYFQRAIAKDPNYARAYAGLADTFALMSTWLVVPQNEFMPKARAAALKALQIDETLSEAHTSLALITECYDWDWQTAKKEFRQAIHLDPGYATAHQWYAEFLSFQGRFDEALAESERARRLDPLSLIIATDHGVILYFSRQYDRAIEQFGAVLEMDPVFPRANTIVYSYVQKGQFAEALAHIEKLRRVYNDPPWIWVWKAYVYGYSGQKAQARHALERFKQLDPRWQMDLVLPLAYVAMDRKDEAIAWLQKACSEQSSIVTALKVDPNYDPLRGDPRFQELLRRIGLAQ
jgi:TolB-like protein/DNA-binding winged helix-turn-helix (wHTH) protein/Tfp pilus assembly protein PilF